MQIKIVDKKEDVKEMTIEELAGKRYIGLRGGSLKYILVSIGYDGGYRFRFVNPDYTLDIVGPKKVVLKKYITGGTHGEGHVFDTARELYLWMAELGVEEKLSKE